MEENSILVKHLLRKKQLMLQGSDRHERYKTMLIILSGGMGGAFGAGCTIGLHECGLANVFDTVIGFSTGAGNGAYFLGGYEQSMKGASIYFDDLSKHFVSYFPRFHADVDHIGDLISTGEKKIDSEAIKKHRSKFYVGLTNATSGRSVLMNAKMELADIPKIVKASVAMPGLYNKTVRIQNQEFIDGALGSPFPVQKIIDKFAPTDVFVIANRPRSKVSFVRTMLTNLGTSLFLANVPAHIRNLCITRNMRLLQQMKYLHNTKGVTSKVIWGVNNVGLLTMDHDKLLHASEVGRRKIHELFD